MYCEEQAARKAEDKTHAFLLVVGFGGVAKLSFLSVAYGFHRGGKGGRKLRA